MSMNPTTDQQKKDALMAKMRSRQAEYLSNPLRMLDANQGRIPSFLQPDEKSWLEETNLELDVPDGSPVGTILVKSNGKVSPLTVQDSESIELQRQADIAWAKRDAMVSQNAFKIFQ